MIHAASLGKRLSLAAAGFIAIAVVIATIAIGFILHRFVQGQIDQRLDAHVVFLSSMLRAQPDGELALSGDANGPPFDRSSRGWYWQVAGPRNTLRSASLEGADLVAQPKQRPPKRRDDDRGARPDPADGPGPRGQPLHFRVLTVATDAGPATVTVSSPRDAVIGPLREALTTLAASLGLLALALILATLLQVRLGLRPLSALRRDLQSVRGGFADRLPDDQPAEIRPLVEDLNALFAQNTANLERARRHVANLAHALKTPLATLAIVLSDRDRAGAPAARSLVESMEGQIRHHLGRARMAAIDGPARSRIPVAAALADLVAVLQKVFAERAIDVQLDAAADLAVACDQQDFDEIAGNILENAFKWAKARIRVTASAAPGAVVVLRVDDDGPGLSAADVARVLKPGQRLDESTAGFGFGLPIARELAELYGGSLAIGPSLSGGTSVTVRLSAAEPVQPARDHGDARRPGRAARVATDDEARGLLQEANAASHRGHQ